ncbi:DUF2306 domain-containing protein [Vitiosangium sp. GDMCC 1.1324]|uniref:DUF2306 domain-containing protein n=1 Tax=Vitiosangium sp. (strain GDMCC 1.1324) TaxID=2138576 RepID=UPI000D3CC112|nr:DUF2306 domain-containing protein [Vitiosangium sp. GDMCC 1.1324]PTL76100.1 DUF2306 domain-containing protein [Vitiosangium sp. GDMCC 1.1324]
MSLVPTVLLWIHVAAGMTALSVFWLPMVARKGGPLHRRVGWVYVGAMAAVAVTGIAMCGWQLATNRSASLPSYLFLGYVGVLSWASASLGVRVLRAKSRTAAHRHPYDLGLPVVLILAAVGILSYGVVLRAPLLMGFAPVGLLVGGSQLRYWLRPPTTRMHWWYEHLGAMVGSSIGALTAFLVVNAHRLGLNGFQLWLWLTPTVVGVVGMRLWVRHYQRRFEARPAPARGPVATRATP